MLTETLPKSYAPRQAEPEIRARWDADRPFHAQPEDGGEPYCILIPPPNVTAALHLGHALNNTLQDVLVRYHRMRGCNTLWMPGTDHAGIATQTVVEKRLLQNEGKRRTDFSRDEFVAKVQQWKDEYEATIIEQLKLMGCSCDFDRTRFTMDEICARAVREAFFLLFRDGLIYRGKRLVNWDPVTQTALADDEVDMEEVQSHFWYLRYPLVHPPENPSDPRDCQEVTWSELASRGYPGAERHPEEEPAWVTVATTRPETYLGDTAVAVHPDDPRAASLRGLMAQLPLVGRVIPIIEDEYVVRPDGDSQDAKAQYATGFLKVTPAHDPNDWEIGQRHGLDVINVMAPDASISNGHGWEDVGDAKLFLGKSREAARDLVVKEFKARGLLEKVRDYTHSVGHSYRSHVPIEPYLSDQWYVRVTDDRMKGEALRALTGDQFEGAKPARQAASEEREGDSELRFFPARYARTFQHWHENLRDWCISRQLWWGHRIPVWHKRVKVTEQNWVDLLSGDDGLDDILTGNIESAFAIIQRVSDGAVVNWRRELNPVVQSTEGEYDVYICAVSDSEMKPFEEHGYAQDPDVLDTWFSSALWPLSTMGWPQPGDFPETLGLLDTFNPSSVLCTAREIITLWVSRMVMFNRYFRDGKLPFRHVYIHPMIQDGHGQKMSKSLGNGVDPRDIIHTHGADALRFVLTQTATATQDVRMPVDMLCPSDTCGEMFVPKEMTSPAGYRVAAPVQKCPKCGREMISGYGAASGTETPTDDLPLARNSSRKFDLGRNFANKLWNATRFALSHLNSDKAQGFPSPALADLPIIDRWMIARLHRALHAVEDAVAEYQFNVYAETMYDLVWRDFCDWYLEAIKPSVRESPAQQQVLRTVLNAILRMLHPIMPFVTETLWPHVQSAGPADLPGIDLPESDLICLAPWPDIECSVEDSRAAQAFERVQNLVNAIRHLRAEHKVPPRRKVTLHATESVRDLISQCDPVVSALAGLESVQAGEGSPAGSVVFTFEGAEQALSGLVEEVDRDAESSRLEKKIADLEKQCRALSGRLNNADYVNKAPSHLVDETRSQLDRAIADLNAARNALESLRR